MVGDLVVLWDSAILMNGPFRCLCSVATCNVHVLWPAKCSSSNIYSKKSHKMLTFITVLIHAQASKLQSWSLHPTLQIGPDAIPRRYTLKLKIQSTINVHLSSLCFFQYSVSPESWFIMISYSQKPESHMISRLTACIRILWHYDLSDQARSYMVALMSFHGLVRDIWFTQVGLQMHMPPFRDNNHLCT